MDAQQENILIPAEAGKLNNNYNQLANYFLRNNGYYGSGVGKPSAVTIQGKD
jgi:hypothetical protein